MLYFPEGFGVTNYQDEVQKHLNERFLAKMDYFIDHAEIEGLTKQRQFLKIGKCLEEFGFEFPKGMSLQKAGETFVGLYSLLNSDKKWVPTLEMEFFLAELIRDGLDDEEFFPQDDKTFTNSAWKIPEHIQKDTVSESVKRCIKISDIEDIDTKSEEFANLVAERVMEEFNSYIRYTPTMYDKCFWDCDYDLLRDYTLEEIRISPANIACGIVGPESDEEYILPRGWRKSKNFKFTNRKPMR